MSDNPYRPPIVDEIWTLVKENQEGMKKLRATQQENAEQLKELRATQQETAEQLKKTAEQLKKTSEQLKETDKQLKKTDAHFNSQWGKLIESLVEGKLVQLLKAKQIEVKETSQRIKTSYVKENGEIKNKEFDILVINGLEFVLVEVKSTLKPDDVSYFLKAMRDVKKYFPAHAKKKAYGVVAYLTSDSRAHLYAERQGLFVIKATGDSASIINQGGI